MPQGVNNTAINRIAFVGNYLPRQCGIATFTTDLCEAIAAEHGDTTCIAVPVNDIEAGYAYPPRGAMSGSLGRKKSTSNGATWTTWFFLADTRLHRMVTPCTSITARPIPASPWPPAVSARFSSGLNTMATNQRQH